MKSVGMKFNLWRAPLDNDKQQISVWNSMCLRDSTAYERATKVEQLDGCIVITTDFAMASPTRFPHFNVIAEWSVFADGRIELHLEAKVGDGLTFTAPNWEIDNPAQYTKQRPAYLPKFGLLLEFDNEGNTCRKAIHDSVRCTGCKIHLARREFAVSYI